MKYEKFLSGKRQMGCDYGFDPVFMPDQAFTFQRDLIEWSVRKGRAALFADCGMGKTLMQLAWAQNVAQKTGQRVLILTPLAVSHQTVIEAKKFGIEVSRSNTGELPSQIVVTNYERLHHFNSDDFDGVVCDESSILKNFSGSTCRAITEFMGEIKYRLLCTATAAPNDFVELGTSSEALGVLKRQYMMAQFFNHDGGETSKWRLKRHAAEGPFWRWLATWSRAIRRPSDMGYDDGDFALPDLITKQHVVEAIESNPEFLFAMPAVGLTEQREERKRTVQERCEMAAELVSDTGSPAICWTHLNRESDLLESMIPDSVQVSGSDKDEEKEEKFQAFESGEARVIVTKPTIAGFGLNWQHCNHQTFFPSHSFEQWYQAIRRSWRFGQKHPVTVDVISTEGEQRVLANLERKAADAAGMFEQLVKHMNQDITPQTRKEKVNREALLPSWI